MCPYFGRLFLLQYCQKKINNFLKSFEFALKFIDNASSTLQTRKVIGCLIAHLAQLISQKFLIRHNREICYYFGGEIISAEFDNGQWTTLIGTTTTLR